MLKSRKLQYLCIGRAENQLETVFSWPVVHRFKSEFNFAVVAEEFSTHFASFNKQQCYTYSTG
jgi:hypothetical protein